MLDELNQTIKEVSKDIPSINYGGCGVFAAKLGEYLQKKYKLTPRILVLLNRDYRKEFKYEPSKFTFGKFNGKGIYLTHCLVYFEYNGEPMYADSTGIFKKHEYLCKYRGIEYHKHLSIEDVKKLVRYKNYWNDSFNRNHIKEISSRFKKELKSGYC